MKYGYMNEWMDGGHHAYKSIDKDILTFSLQTLDNVSKGDKKQGQWCTKHIDGTFNCVPSKFYNNVWHTLEKCEEIFIDNPLLPKNPIVHEVRHILILGLTLIPIPENSWRTQFF